MPTQTVGVRDLFWPTISDRESAKKAAMSGFMAAALVAGVTALVLLLSTIGVPLAGPRRVSPFILTDIAVFALIGWGITKLSRVAAIAGLLLFLFERAYAYSQGRPPGAGVLMAILVTLWFVDGIRGTFAYHRYLATRDSTPSSLGP